MKGQSPVADAGHLCEAERMWRSQCIRSFGRRIELQAPDELRILVLTLVQ